MFKRVTLMVCLAPTLLLAQPTVAGDWLLTEDVYGNPLHQRLTLGVDGTALSGTLRRRMLAGRVEAGEAALHVRPVTAFGSCDWRGLADAALSFQ